MKKQPFFTIGIPVYNTEKWVGECLDSILGQSFDDFEIICVNDGSADASLDVLHRYAQKDDRIKVVSRPNSGPATARNAAMYNANGKYMYFMDSDDVMTENALATAYSYLEQNEFPDVMETGLDVISFGETTTYRYSYPGDEYFSPELTKDERAIKLWLDKTYIPSSAAKFIKLSYIKSCGLMFNPHYLASEDADFSFQIHRTADTIAYAPFSPFTYYSPRENSITTSFSPKAYYSKLSYYLTFFGNTTYWKLSDKYRVLVEEKKKEFVFENLLYTISILKGNISKSDVMERIAVVEHFFGRRIKLKDIPRENFSFIYVLYSIFGIRPTVSLLYDYLKFKGVITNE